MKKKTSKSIAWAVLLIIIIGSVSGIILYFLGGTGDTSEPPATCQPATRENGRYDVDDDDDIDFIDSGLINSHRTDNNASMVYDMRYDMDCDGDVDETDAMLCWENRDSNQ